MIGEEKEGEIIPWKQPSVFIWRGRGGNCIKGKNIIKLQIFCPNQTSTALKEGKQSIEVLEARRGHLVIKSLIQHKQAH